MDTQARQSPVIVWFRQDLRHQDNPALSQACALNTPILPLFILEENIRPLGGAAQWWLHHSLAHLRQTLGFLCLQKGDPESIFRQLIVKTGATQVFWNNRFDPMGHQKDAQLMKTLAELGVQCHVSPGNVLFDPGTQLNKSNKPFQVFTPYWRQCRQQLHLAIHLTPTRPQWTVFPHDSLSLDDFQLLPHSPDWASGFKEMWTPGEAGALCRLEKFVQMGLHGYAKSRDYPAETQGTSGLSPHLHWGEISVQRVVHNILLASQNNPALSIDAEVFLSELGWREFSNDCLMRFPQMARQPIHSAFSHFPWEMNPDHLTAWQKGLTGYPIVDAGMRQLWKTGWMHNRVRMIVASFLTKHLLIPWQKGEEWFWDTLVDADEANNAMGWQWVAGCGMDASPYFRIFNPVLQGEKFDPKGEYIRQWIPELASLDDAYIHAPWMAPPLVLAAAGVTLGKTYPSPLVDHATCRSRALAAYQQIRSE